MSFGNWLSHAALGGLLVALSFGLSGEGHAQSNAPGQPAQAQQQQTTPTPPPVVQQPIPDPADYTVRCDHPKNREDADLCEQRRQAQAAEEAVWWAKTQTFLGIFGASLVILSLVFTGWAAIAAARAAQAAERAINQDEEREAPFVYPVVITDAVPDVLVDLRKYDHPRSPVTPQHPVVTCALVNHGRTAALMEWITIDLIHLPEMPEPMPIPIRHSFAVPPLLAQGAQSTTRHDARITIPLDREAAQSVIDRQSFLYLFGEICFGSVGGTAYRQTFCMAYDPAAKGFAPLRPSLNQRKRR